MTPPSAACEVNCPGSSRFCERYEGHDGEHQSTLSPGRTFVYWTSDSYPVKYRVGVIDRVLDCAAARALSVDVKEPR